MPSTAGSPSAVSFSFSFTTLFLAAATLGNAVSFSSAWSLESPARERRIDRRADTNTTTIPAAISIAPSQYFEGNDGPWSSFALQVGTPAQDVRVFPSTASTFIWTIGAAGCPANYVDDCDTSRGGIFNSTSLSWVANSIYGFGLEDNLGMDTSGNAGWDTATLDWQGSGGPTYSHSTIFIIADSQYWLGQFGLNPRPTNFSNFVDPQISFLQALKSNNTIPSLSYGYTAGNQYGVNKAFGSLVLGGYDESRFEPTNLTFPFYTDISRDLLVNVQAITTGSDATNLLPDGSIPVFIDSTVPTIWLPESACTAFEDAFNLTWSTDYSRYLVNSTQHATLLSNDRSVTFTLGPNVTGGDTVDIILPYGAFDLQVEFPIVENPNTSYYFPLMRAANETQYTLGRAFLQAAYLIADYERQNFTVAPSIYDYAVSENLHTILSPNATISNGKGGGGGITSGVIAGIVIAIVAAIAILGLILWWFRRRKQTEKKRVAELEAKEAGGAGKDSHDSATGSESKPFISNPIGGELGGGEIHELTAPNRMPMVELDSPYRTDPNKVGYSEMEGGEYFGPGKNFAHEMQGSEQAVYEMQGSDVHEMGAGEVGRAGERK
ncbi:hypothetical protein LTR08_002886 [Meristemomyces frigidus]|nr:hypothetical protein LTR08_002886 [Meristemomyces frigidus]